MHRNVVQPKSPLIAPLRLSIVAEIERVATCGLRSLEENPQISQISANFDAAGGRGLLCENLRNLWTKPKQLAVIPYP